MALIESWAALPRRSEAYLTERQWFDVKATYAPERLAEMAKDVAAFANALGGAIIVGATEGHVEPDYSAPLPAKYAEDRALDFDKAVRDYCRPSPAIHVRAIPSPGAPGKVVLVVNIEPAVDQPIAARHAEDKDAWRFPIRVGRDTEFLLPEQLPLYMNSKARRAKLLLLRALAAGGDIDLFCVPSGGSKHNVLQGRSRFKLDAVDVDRGGGVQLRDGTGELRHQSIVIPLDDVEAVWIQQDGSWAMRVSGRMETFDSFDGQQKGALIYTPPTTFVVSPLGAVVEELGKHVRDVARTLGSTLVVQNFERREPLEDEIRERAHRFWLMREERGFPGSATSDWVNARRALLAERRDG
ncbi:MAG: putative DNA binding domain-containing protein [Myxococcales bacterium]|nr:putative DNA binding domain-containing protein [Myxococcales bacterium]